VLSGHVNDTDLRAVPWLQVAKGAGNACWSQLGGAMAAGRTLQCSWTRPCSGLPSVDEVAAEGMRAIYQAGGLRGCW